MGILGSVWNYRGSSKSKSSKHSFITDISIPGNVISSLLFEVLYIWRNKDVCICQIVNLGVKAFYRLKLKEYHDPDRKYKYYYRDCANIGPLVKWLECSPKVQETRVQSQVESYQRLKNSTWCHLA